MPASRQAGQSKPFNRRSGIGGVVNQCMRHFLGRSREFRKRVRWFCTGARIGRVFLIKIYFVDLQLVVGPATVPFARLKFRHWLTKVRRFSIQYHLNTLSHLTAMRQFLVADANLIKSERSSLRRFEHRHESTAGNAPHDLEPTGERISVFVRNRSGGQTVYVEPHRIRQRDRLSAAAGCRHCSEVYSIADIGIAAAVWIAEVGAAGQSTNLSHTVPVSVPS